jgi:replicative DNA helicase
MTFDEKVFLWAMTCRPADCRVFATKFQPSWLRTAEYVPVLDAIFNFLKKHGVPPSFQTLHQVFRDNDPNGYNARVKATLDELIANEPDLSSMVYVVEQANNLSIVRSMNELTTDQSFLLKLSQGMGREVLQDVHKWLNQHMGVDEDKTYTLDEAVANLFQAQQFKEVITAIPTDIQCIDDWCGGGLRLGQLGLIMAPTGHGKSVCLILMAQKIASIQELPVWFVTNELTMEETTERFLARITGVKLGQIIKNPVNAMGDWVRYGKSQYDKNLWISEVNREVSMDELEAEMMRRANLYGTMPKVICLDFMERMKPNGKGYNRDSSWNWLGAIAQDIARFAKKHKILVWTAAQTNRSGLTSNTLDPGMIQGSIKHLQEATAMVSMNQLREVKDEIIMQFQALKMRQSARSNEPVYVKCDLSTMTITNETISRDEIIARGADDDTSTPTKKPLTPGQQQQLNKKLKAKAAFGSGT